MFGENQWSNGEWTLLANCFFRVNKDNNIYEHWPQWKSMYLMWGIKGFY